MTPETPQTNDEPTVVIHGDRWKIKDVADDVRSLVTQTRRREIWKPTAALIHKKGGRSTQYRGQKFDPEKISLVSDGWNHDHCAICWWTLHETDDPEKGIGYRNETNVWICSECYQHFFEQDILNFKQNSEQGRGANALTRAAHD
jgi:hypothetical protein